MAKALFGLVLALLIGALCRLSGIPAPAPPAIVGSLLVLSMTSGYLLMDRLAAHPSARSEDRCGGPVGVVDRPEARP